jgi:hypothetical protein
MQETDGSFHLWRDLSDEARLDHIVRDAAFYDVPFKQFTEAARESIDSGAIEEAALRLAMRSGRELFDLEKLFPDDGRTEPSPPLIERVSELLTAKSREQENDAGPTREGLTALFKEIRADEAATKREDAHWYGKEALEKILDGKKKDPALEKGKDKDFER